LQERRIGKDVLLEDAHETGIIGDAEAATHRGLGVAEYIPGKTEPRSEVPVRIAGNLAAVRRGLPVDADAVQRIAGGDAAGDQTRRRRDHGCLRRIVESRIEGGQHVVRVIRLAVDRVPDTKVQSEVRAELPIVLEVPLELV